LFWPYRRRRRACSSKPKTLKIAEVAAKIVDADIGNNAVDLQETVKLVAVSSPSKRRNSAFVIWPALYSSSAKP
jgi:hypothetical protein